MNQLTSEQTALYKQALCLIARAQTLLLNARAKHEQKERELCYRTQASPVGKPLC